MLAKTMENAAKRAQNTINARGGHLRDIIFKNWCKQISLEQIKWLRLPTAKFLFFHIYIIFYLFSQFSIFHRLFLKYGQTIANFSLSYIFYIPFLYLVKWPVSQLDRGKKIKNFNSYFKITYIILYYIKLNVIIT